MCLLKLYDFSGKFSKLWEEFTVYKVAYRMRGNSGESYYYTPIIFKRMMEGENICSVETLETDTGMPYLSGFHCYLYKKHAKRHASLFGGKIIKFSVKKTDILAMGQDSPICEDYVIVFSKVYYSHSLIDRIIDKIYGFVSNCSERVERVFDWLEGVGQSLRN